MEIPPRFERDLRQLADLERRAQDEPELQHQEIALMEGILRRLAEGESRSFRGELLGHLGVVYMELRSGDRTANLQQAIACFTEALRFRTPDAAPMDYALTQSNLGAAYAELPTGDQTANLQQAIACFTEALRFRTPDAAPMDYAWT
jgi:tetratricopeptide (TPR) repeat protein